MSQRTLLFTSLAIILGGAVAVVTYQLWNKGRNKKIDDSQPKTIIETDEESIETPEEPKKARTIKLLYGSTTGTARNFANTLLKHLEKKCKDNQVLISLVDLADYNEESIAQEDVIIILCSTYENGVPPVSAEKFFTFINEQSFDFRVSKDYLASVKYVMFGLGGKIYGSNYGKAVKNLHDDFERLGAKCLYPLTLGDDASNLEQVYYKWSSKIVKMVLEEVRDDDDVDEKDNDNNDNNDNNNNKQKTATMSMTRSTNKKVKKAAAMTYGRSRAEIQRSAEAAALSAAGSVSRTPPVQLPSVVSSATNKNEDCGCSSGGSNKKDKASSSSIGCCKDNQEAKKKTAEDGQDGAEEEEEEVAEQDEDEEDDEEHDEEIEEDLEDQMNDEILDLEEVGKALQTATAHNNKTNNSSNSNAAPREMVTKLQHQALTKEGYRIIGTHSAVKLCRWTKHQLRGRGGCYKHSFYGITSYQCMEATPSLACANKCVFCWRHHKNPVGTSWRWKTDAPDFIVNEAISMHVNMISQMKGVPGVQPERLQEAMTVRHCALSLVGEPIMYPQINEMIRALHQRKISSFLVTNAQFPDRIMQLEPVTQLYVSVDAASKESLKAVDRPLFNDFWERFLGSLEALQQKRQRTVYRMTLVKAWNMAEVDAYVQLIAKGQPDFIEIKAVTYCGKSDASSLTMQNVPWHEEVCAYGEEICRQLATLSSQQPSIPVYNIATEHAHSCCILIAREDKFKREGVWHTWIDYEKFHLLMQEYYASDGKKCFGSEDYQAETPHWAIYRAAERGFDPQENRWRRNKLKNQLHKQEQNGGEEEGDGVEEDNETCGPQPMAEGGESGCG